MYIFLSNFKIIIANSATGAIEGTIYLMTLLHSTM